MADGRAKVTLRVIESIQLGCKTACEAIIRCHSDEIISGAKKSNGTAKSRARLPLKVIGDVSRLLL